MKPFYKRHPEISPEIASLEMATKARAFGLMAVLGVPVIAGIDLAVIYQLNLASPWAIATICAIVGWGLAIWLYSNIKRGSLCAFFLLMDGAFVAFFLLFLGLLVMILRFDANLGWDVLFVRSQPVLVSIAAILVVSGFVVTNISYRRHAERVDHIFQQQRLSPVDVHHAFFALEDEGKWLWHRYLFAAAIGVGIARYADQFGNGFSGAIPLLVFLVLYPVVAFLIGTMLARWKVLYGYFRTHGDIVISPPLYSSWF